MALLRGLAESLIVHEHIETTSAKARALRRFVEPLVTSAKRGTLSDRRRVMRVLYTDHAVRKLFATIAPRYASRAGGYTRVTKMGFRSADNGEKVRIEFV